MTRVDTNMFPFVPAHFPFSLLLITALIAAVVTDPVRVSIDASRSHPT
jgi:hypothetical protein